MEETEPKTGEEEEKISTKGTEMNLKDQENDLLSEKPYKMYAAVSFVFIMIFLGVPLWWKTTEVYRASLPYAHIDFLSNLPVEVPISLRFVYFDQETNSTVHEAVKRLAQTLRETKFHKKLEIPFRLFTSQATNSQKSALHNSASFKNLDDQLYGRTSSEQSSEELSLQIFVVPAEFSRSKEGEIRCFFGQSTGIFVRNSMSEDSIAKTIEEAILEVYLNTERMKEIFGRTLKDPSKTDAISINRKIWTGSLHPHQVLDYYLINPEPEKCLTDSLDLQKVLETSLKPLYDKLKPVTEVSVKSQKVYHVGLPSSPSYNKEEQFYYFSAEQLSHLINPLERFVTIIEPEKPVFHLMILVTPPENFPLYVLEEGGKRAMHNGFLVASWGGLTVYNTAKGCNESIDDMEEKVLEGIVSQLRILLGTSPDSLPEGIIRYNSPLATWELHKLMMHALAENMLTAGTTLQSLTRLLSGIRNIVISDEIGERIEKAIEGLQHTVLALDARNVPKALEHSKTALLEAEKAFSDPSLLALLYFPDDQKYAIYIPLFLPVGLPVLLSLKQILKFWKERRKVKTE